MPAIDDPTWGSIVPQSDLHVQRVRRRPLAELTYRARRSAMYRKFANVKRITIKDAFPVVKFRTTRPNYVFKPPPSRFQPVESINMVWRWLRGRKKDNETLRAISHKNRLFRYNVLYEITTCPICMQDFEDEDDVRVLPCAHMYHTKCVDHWFNMYRRSCPTCHAPIPRCIILSTDEPDLWAREEAVRLRELDDYDAI